MKRKKTFLLCLIIASILLFPLLLYSDTGLRLSLEVKRIAKLPYLPIEMQINLINESSTDIMLPQKPYLQDYLKFIIEGKQDFSCALHPQGERIGIVHYFTIEKGKTYQHSINNFALEEGLLNPGMYRIKAIWDSREASKGFKGYSESAWITIEIQEPIGQDLMFIEDFQKKDPSFDRCLIYTATIPKELLDKYPDSIYAAWALWSGAYLSRYYREEDLESAEKVVNIVIGKEKRGMKMLHVLGCGIITNKNKQIAENLVEILPEGELKAGISECLGVEFLTGKNYKKAIKYLTIASSRKRSKEFLEAIKKFIPDEMIK